jgi:hypothetical protein
MCKEMKSWEVFSLNGTVVMKLIPVSESDKPVFISNIFSNEARELGEALCVAAADAERYASRPNTAYEIVEVPSNTASSPTAPSAPSGNDDSEARRHAEHDS